MSLRITPHGIVIIGLNIITLIMAINYHNNLLYAVSYLWLALIITSGIRSSLLFKKVTPNHWLYDDIFAKTPALFTLRLNDNGYCDTLRIKGYKGITWKTNLQQRGKQTLYPPKLEGLDTLGIWAYCKPIEPIVDVWVFAHPKAHIHLNDHTQACKTESHENDDIQQLRTYRSEDSFKSIDWKASARSQDWVARDYHGQQTDKSYQLDWQNLNNLNDDKKRETLTAWVLELNQRGHNWDLRIPHLYLESLTGHQHRTRCLIALAG